MIKYNTKNCNKISDPFFIENLKYKDKNIVIRVDWNIPTKDNKIIDDFRIISSLNTINYILDQNPNRIIIISHLGRPNGFDIKYSWINFIDQLQKYFKIKLTFLDDGLTTNTISLLNESKDKLFLLENIRFCKEETNYNENLSSKSLDIYNKLGDIFVNDAFGACHRNHMSITACRKRKRSYGYLIDKEINLLKKITSNNTNYKILAIIGGGKMDDKLPLLESLSNKVDGIYLAGGNINSILKNEEYKKYIAKISRNKSKIHLMTDGIGSSDLISYPEYRETEYDNNFNFFDIGHRSIIELEKLIKCHDIIFWNGPLGVIENNLYKNGSEVLLDILKKSDKNVIIGGGDTAGFINQYSHSFENISTGGGASLEFISNDSLVGLNIFK